MQVSNPNNVRIYNLSVGKSLPEWLSEKKKRSMQKKDIDIQRRIQLLQDFEMPQVSNCVELSRDGQYVIAAGVYKPRIRCYDVSQMSMKFERCVDSEIVKFHMLEDDYSKLILLQNDRYVEFHAQHGRYYRTRIPKYGRDMSYHKTSCDLYVVGASSEIYRLNLEQGKFMNSLQSSAQEIHCCQFNDYHDLFSCGTTGGTVESWDPRVRSRVGLLDVTSGITTEDDETLTGIPTITSLTYNGPLNVAVGTSSGHVLLYDIRSSKPLLVKDHRYGLPIKKIYYLNDNQDLMMSIDKKVLKIWHRSNGKAYTAIEPGTGINDLCVVPKSGLFFMANEAPKILTYYIPAVGPAPKWCYFLDNLTEELEESQTPMVYDDYQFVTRKDLESLGLTHLIGTNLLRAYMHGYFMDIRLYKKTKAIAEPFAFEEYKKQKIREKIESERVNRVQIKKLPKVNRQLAEKLMESEDEDESVMEEKKKKKKKKVMPNLLKDDRFSALFANPDFEVDTESPEYRLLNPVVSKLDKVKRKQSKLAKQFQEVEEGAEEREGRPSSEDESESSDDDHTWADELKQQYRQLNRETRLQEMTSQQEPMTSTKDGANVKGQKTKGKAKFLELKDGESFGVLQDKKKKKLMKKTLGERLAAESDDVIRHGGVNHGGREMTFTLKKSDRELARRKEMLDHHRERRKIRRSAGEITRKMKPKSKFFMGKRVR